MKKDLIVLLVDVKNNGAELTVIKDDLQVFYDFIKCHTIDITSRRIEDEYFDFICDDEGLFESEPIPSAMNSNNEVQLVGNLIVCGGADEDGDLNGLSEKQVEILKRNLKGRITENGILPILCNVEY